MKLRLLSVLALLLVDGCADPAPTYQAPAYYAPVQGSSFSANAASLQLKKGMTEEDAIRTLGSQPESADLSTCGTRTPHPWQCKSMTYHDSPRGPYGTAKMLTVVLQENQSTGVWYVSGWWVL